MDISLLDVEKLLGDGAGNHDRIRAFRETLQPGEREVFDSIFLLGFREGVLLNLSDCVAPSSKEATSINLHEYVQIASTTYYKKPPCFGEYGKGENCKLCPVRNQCLGS